MDYYPKQAVWELSLKCNLNCLHCGSSAGAKRKNELNLAECLDIADQLIKLNCHFITLIGGELLLRNDWWQIAKRFVDHGVYTNIITNAYRMRDQHFEALRKSGVRQVAISIDGMKEAHNKVRRNRNSFQEIERAIKQLQSEHRYSLEAVTTLNRLNLADLPELYRFLINHQFDVWQIQLMTPMGNAKNKNDLVLRPEEIKQVMKFIHAKGQEPWMNVVAGDSIGYFNDEELYLRGINYGSAEEENVFPGCQAGMYVVGIDSSGDVRGCLSQMDDRFIEGNLRENTLEEIWNKDGAFAYNRNFDRSMLTGKCAICPQGERCRGGCRQTNAFTSKNQYESMICCR